MGEFKWSGRQRKRIWTCNACDPEFNPTKAAKELEPSWLEKKVMPILAKSGYHFIREFPLAKFRFDFALPKLWLLIEVDSHLWHRRPRQKARDKAKDAVAMASGWEVARVREPDLEGKVRAAIDQRAQVVFEV